MTQTLDDELGEPAPPTSTTDRLMKHRRRMRKKVKERNAQEPSLVRDILGWIVIICGVAWLLTLISYDPRDPSAFHETSVIVPSNLLGKIGANVAAYCFEFLGFGSLLFPLYAIYLGIQSIRARRANDWFFQIIGGGGVVFVLLTFLGSCATVTINRTPTNLGGWIGINLWRFFSGYLNPFGTYLFLFGSTGLALLVATRLTLKDLGLWIGKILRMAGSSLVALFQRLAAFREQRAEEKTRQRIIQRELDRIESDKKTGQPKVKGKTAEIDPVLVRGVGDSLDLDETDSRELPTETLPTPSEPLPNGTPEGIKVNPMKTTKSAQESFQFVREMEGSWVYPNSFFFNKAGEDQKIDESELIQKAKALENKFGEFSVTGQMREIHPGPVVTTYEFKPDAGIKYSKVVNLAEDLCLALGAESIRIDRMPGKSSIGLEVPNNKRELITFREMIESEKFQSSKNKLLVCLGKTIDGTPYFTDLSKMPHLLIAGQTGSGKSVGINGMICSILMRNRPDEVKMILIDPKMVEMGIYADIPHLLTPVVTDPFEASNALKWAVGEMERRYKLLASYNFRNMDHYNRAAKRGDVVMEGEEEPLPPMPLILVIIDELADLMMVARGEVEESIARLAQKSRAIGIHLILATQRPSVDIITGVIKSNLPARLGYRVAQKNDSRIILDTNGADKLLGKGDGLFLGPGTSRLVRVHAPYISETEVLDLVKFLKNQGSPQYDHQVLRTAEGSVDAGDEPTGFGTKTKDDPMYDKAARLVVRSGQASVSYLQRKLSLGYARAAKLVDMMEEDGIVGPNLGSKARDILVPADYFDEIDNRL